MIEKKWYRSGLQRQYDWEAVQPAVAIIELIAELEGVQVSETASVLNLPFQAYVDTDALTTLVQSENTTSITLNISQYHVQIDGNTVEVIPIAEE